jgi:putative endonuclease
MSDPRHQFGEQGEALAERYLRKRGFRTVARRHLTPVGELDLIMTDANTVVFVEVKTRRDRRCADPEDAVGSVKQRRLTRAARWFLQQRRWEERPCRFDVVTVVLAPDASELQYYKDAFPPHRG